LNPTLGNAGSHSVYPLADDDLVLLDLPFDWTWYGSVYNEVWVSSNGVLFFEGESSSAVGSCPGDNLWSGIAPLWQDWSNVTVQTSVFGQYPYRNFVVDWTGSHPVVGGDGHVQVWLTEGAGTPRVVVVLDDIQFGIPVSTMERMPMWEFKVKRLELGLNGGVWIPYPINEARGLDVLGIYQWLQKSGRMICCNSGLEINTFCIGHVRFWLKM